MPRLTEEQRTFRRTGITATDVVILAGLSPYRNTSAHMVWAEKIGLDVPPLEGEHLELGHELEPIVLRRLAARRGLTLAPGVSLRSAVSERHIATPDGLQYAGETLEAVAEAKAVGFTYANLWGEEGGEVPDHVLAQVQWQAYVAGVPVAYVGALLGGTEVRTYRIERDQDVIDSLIETADQFWTDHVVTRRPPAIDGSPGSGKMLRALFPRTSGPIVQATDEAEQAAALYFEAKQAAERAEATIDSAKQMLAAACGSAEGVQGDGWRLHYKLRAAREVAPKPYTLPEQRVFDLRRMGAR